MLLNCRGYVDNWLPVLQFMAKQSVFTHDILPRIRADHPVLSVITHEWERLANMLTIACEKLDRRLLRWSNANMRIEELIAIF